MKFVALAVLLAVGCQAASMQADAPPDPLSVLEHVRAFVRIHATDFKEALIRAFDHLDDAEQKARLTDRVNEAFNFLSGLQQSAQTHTDAFVTQFSEITTEPRAKLYADYEKLHNDLQPHYEKLSKVILEHLAQYRTHISDYLRDHGEEINVFKTNLWKMLEGLFAMMGTNWEETKTALTPIVDAVCDKIKEHVGLLIKEATPYYNEYREQADKTMAHIKTLKQEEVLEKLKQPTEDLKNSLNNILEEINKIITPPASD